MKRCPCCNLPGRPISRAFSASTKAGEFGVFLICQRCDSRLAKLPTGPQSKALDRAAEKALDDPDRFLAKILPDQGAADLVLALLRHPGYVAEMLRSVMVE